MGSTAVWDTLLQQPGKTSTLSFSKSLPVGLYFALTGGGKLRRQYVRTLGFFLALPAPLALLALLALLAFTGLLLTHPALLYR